MSGHKDSPKANLIMRMIDTVLNQALVYGTVFLQQQHHITNCMLYIMYTAKHYQSMHAGEQNPTCTSAVHAQMSTKLEVSYPGQTQKT
jgi:hypothetical protein